MTNLDRLRILGEALHGPHWKHPTARDLGIPYRTVTRWVNEGVGAPGDGHISDLAAIAQERADALTDAISRIESKVAFGKA